MAPVISLHIGPRTDDFFNKMFPTDGGQETVDSPKRNKISRCQKTTNQDDV